MARSDSFRRQHAELASLALDIRNRLSVEEIERDARGIRTLLARFGGKLRMHARMENEALYPDLMTHRDESVRRQAGKLLDEVGALYAVFDRLEQKWASAEVIAPDPRAFILDVLACFDQLGRRMSVENKTLYPLADAADAAE
jgi:hemerythrin-like domain-containing protein